MGLFACSGPGAGAAIARSIEIGYTQAEVMGGLVGISCLILAVRPRNWLVLLLLLGMLLLHPAWTISAISGDCGYLKRYASYLFTALGCAGLLFQVGQLIWRRIRPPSPPDR